MKQTSKIGNQIVLPHVRFDETGVGDTFAAKNGLYKDGTTVKLGQNPLIEDTTIDTSNRTLFIDGGNFAHVRKTIELTSGANIQLKREHSGAAIYRFKSGSTGTIILPKPTHAENDGLEFHFICTVSNGLTIVSPYEKGDKQTNYIRDVELGLHLNLHAKTEGVCHLRFVGGYGGFWMVLSKSGTWDIN
jgi:hypothetical protein